MMTQDTAGREDRPASLPGAGEACQAGRHADALSDLILSGTLSPGGLVAAHGARGLLLAVLALRETVTGAAADAATAAAGLDATLGIIAGAVTGDGAVPAGGTR